MSFNFNDGQKDKQPLVSVIIPAHNEEENISECIESLLCQTYQNIEIIVVDDCSSDNTYSVATRYPIKIIRLNRNKGPAYARNIGIKNAKGKFIVFAEADAKYSSNYVENIIKPLDNPKIGGAIAGQRLVWSNKNNIIVRYWNYRFKAIGILTKKGLRSIIGAWAFRKNVLNKVGLYDESLRCGEDVDLVSRLKKAGYKIAAILNHDKSSTIINSDTDVVFGSPIHIYMYHKDPDTLKNFVKRIWWGAVKCKKFRERWELEPKGFRKLFFIARNISALLLPIYPVLALFHNLIWLLVFFGVFFAESIFPIIYDRELRLTFRLALEDKDYKLALAMPVICWVEIRMRALGMFYAMLRGDKID